MTMKKMIASGVIAGAVAMAATAVVTNDADAADKKKEKCYGVVKAGHNDCGNAQGTHSCMSQAKTDADGGEWIALPQGICERLAGGSLKPKEDHGHDHGHEH